MMVLAVGTGVVVIVVAVAIVLVVLILAMSSRGRQRLKARTENHDRLPPLRQAKWREIHARIVASIPDRRRLTSALSQTRKRPVEDAGRTLNIAAMMVLMSSSDPKRREAPQTRGPSALAC